MEIGYAIISMIILYFAVSVFASMIQGVGDGTWLVVIFAMGIIVYFVTSSATRVINAIEKKNDNDNKRT